ncbi:MAG: T9SS type A sorting domain-containing protein [Candidatus Paceibacterota bacterium]|jgi:uncharacterized delta-60 repeat protein
MKKLIIIFTFLSTILSNILFAQQGNLDSTFNTNGIITTSISEFDKAYSIAIQSDGKILAAGYSHPINNYDFSVVRYNADGSLDNSFGSGGKVTTDVVTGQSDYAYSIAIQQDGKIIVAGSSNTGTDCNWVLVRYNHDGTLDSTFNGDGKIVTSMSTGFDEALSLAIQTDGKIIVAGYSEPNRKYFALARFNTDGSFDNSFGTNGKLTTAVGTYSDNATSVAIQSDGKIVAAGNSSDGGISYGISLARYNSNGILDTSFSDDGKLTYFYSSMGIMISSLVVQPNGKIILGGMSTNANQHLVMARFNSNGTFDSLFGSNGIVITSIDSNSCRGYSLTLQPDGKIIMAGSAYNSTNHDFALLRYNVNGSLDSTFAINGIITTSIGTGNDVAYSVAIQSDGKIVLGGFSINNTNSYFALARYISGLNIGIIDFPFTNNSILIYPNPIRQNATLEYELQDQEMISIRLVDIQGRSIKTFINNVKQEIGKHQQILSLPAKLPSGYYFINISYGKGQVSIKIIK